MAAGKMWMPSWTGKAQLSISAYMYHQRCSNGTLRHKSTLALLVTKDKIGFECEMSLILWGGTWSSVGGIAGEACEPFGKFSLARASGSPAQDWRVQSLFLFVAWLVLSAFWPWRNVVLIGTLLFLHLLITKRWAK